MSVQPVTGGVVRPVQILPRPVDIRKKAQPYGGPFKPLPKIEPKPMLPPLHGGGNDVV